MYLRSWKYVCVYILGFFLSSFLFLPHGCFVFFAISLQLSFSACMSVCSCACFMTHKTHHRRPLGGGGICCFLPCSFVNGWQGLKWNSWPVQGPQQSNHCPLLLPHCQWPVWWHHVPPKAHSSLWQHPQQSPPSLNTPRAFCLFVQITQKIGRRIGVTVSSCQEWRRQQQRVPLVLDSWFLIPNSRFVIFFCHRTNTSWRTTFPSSSTGRRRPRPGLLCELPPSAVSMHAPCSPCQPTATCHVDDCRWDERERTSLLSPWCSASTSPCGAYVAI